MNGRMTATAENQDASPAPAERGFASPSRRTTLIIAGALAMIVVLRILARTPDAPWPFHDPAHCNVATLIFAFIAAVATWIWFCFRSGLARGVQRVGVVAPLVLAAGFFGMFRLEEVDGNMFPRFEPRWQPRRDQTLGALAPAAEQATADLATTTPDDFPQFLGPERSCWLPEPELARDWNATPPKLLWKQPIGAGWSGFAAVNGFAVTLEQRGAEEWTSCYAIETGKAVWGQAITARHENPLGGVGPRSTPTIHAGRVYSLGATGSCRWLVRAPVSL
jgi:outer membrane protein assembly factor BamB